MSSGQLIGFTLVALVLIVVPGPGVLFIVGRALSYGRRTAVATATGHAAGNYVVAACVAFGLGALLQRSAEVFTAVKLAGALYLVYLGVQAIRHRNSLAVAMSSEAGARDGWRALRDGMVVGMTNPKAYILFGAILPQFINRSAGHVPTQMLALALISVCMGLVSDCTWGVAASAVRSWFARSPRRFAIVGGAGGLAMIGVGVTIALTGRTDLPPGAAPGPRGDFSRVFRRSSRMPDPGAAHPWTAHRVAGGAAARRVAGDVLVPLAPARQVRARRGGRRRGRAGEALAGDRHVDGVGRRAGGPGNRGRRRAAAASSRSGSCSPSCSRRGRCRSCSTSPTRRCSCQSSSPSSTSTGSRSSTAAAPCRSSPGPHPAGGGPGHTNTLRVQQYGLAAMPLYPGGSMTMSNEDVAVWIPVAPKEPRPNDKSEAFRLLILATERPPQRRDPRDHELAAHADG